MELNYYNYFCIQPFQKPSSNYDSNYILTIRKHQYLFEEPKLNYYDPNQPIDKDWSNLIDSDIRIFNKSKYEENKEIFHDFDDKEIKEMSYTFTHRLKTNVLEWLNQNIEDRDDEWGDIKSGWTIGTDEYNSTDVISFSIFFFRKEDALKFIEVFSQYDHPTKFYNGFDSIHQKLNLDTNELVENKRN